jgi:hypothetical protein
MSKRVIVLEGLKTIIMFWFLFLKLKDKKYRRKSQSYWQFLTMFLVEGQTPTVCCTRHTFSLILAESGGICILWTHSSFIFLSCCHDNVVSFKLLIISIIVNSWWSYETFQIIKGHNSGTIHIIVTIKLKPLCKNCKMFCQRKLKI